MPSDSRQDAGATFLIYSPEGLLAALATLATAAG